MESSPKRYHLTCAVSASHGCCQLDPAKVRGTPRYLKTNSESVEVGKRVSQNTTHRRSGLWYLVEFSVHGSLQVQYQVSIVHHAHCVGVAFYREFFQRNVLEEQFAKI